MDWRFHQSSGEKSASNEKQGRFELSNKNLIIASFNIFDKIHVESQGSLLEARERPLGAISLSFVLVEGGAVGYETPFPTRVSHILGGNQGFSSVY